MLNDKEFFPAAIVAALHAPEVEEQKERKESESMKLPLAGYEGEDILREMERLKLKESKKKRDKGGGNGGMTNLSAGGKVFFGR